MRKSLSTFALLLALCCPAFAGDMLTPPYAPPPPSTMTVAPEPDDEVRDLSAVDGSKAPDVSMTGLALSLLERLLAII